MPKRFKELLEKSGYNVASLEFLSKDWESITIRNKVTKQKYIIRY